MHHKKSTSGPSFTTEATVFIDQTTLGKVGGGSAHRIRGINECPSRFVVATLVNNTVGHFQWLPQWFRLIPDGEKKPLFPLTKSRSPKALRPKSVPTGKRDIVRASVGVQKSSRSRKDAIRCPRPAKTQAPHRATDCTSPGSTEYPQVTENEKREIWKILVRCQEGEQTVSSPSGRNEHHENQCSGIWRPVAVERR